MPIYRKKPIEIEARQITGDNIAEICAWSGGEPAGQGNFDGVNIPTLEGTMLGRIGDYIIKGAHGEFYPCAKDIFMHTYIYVRETDAERYVCTHLSVDEGS